MLDSNIVSWRENVIKNFENDVEGQHHDVQKILYPCETKILPLVVKTYVGKGSLSSELFKSKVGDKWNIQGPIVSFANLL